MRASLRLAILTCICTGTACSSGSAPGSTPAPGGSDGAEAMPIYSAALGPHQRLVSTRSPEAQKYFTQGEQLLYAFTPPDALRSFREAQKRDPGCAMCYFGEAWALGPYLNGPMRPDNAPEAYAAIRKAMELREEATPVERALIEAMAKRYEPEHDPDRRRELDEIWSEAIGAVYERYPQDNLVGTLYGESLMLLEPRRGLWDIERPEVRRIHAVLESVLERDIKHPGACHLYIHATEPTVDPGKAEACAEHLGAAIPGASHIQHMPSHTYNRVGRWDDAVRANTAAWHSDLKAEWGEGFAIYPSHNVHMLLFAGSNAGQGGVSAQAARDYAKIVPGGQFYLSLVLHRFGRFDEVLEVTERPEQPIQRGLWEFARGYAHLKVGAPDSARVYLARVQAAATAENADDVNFRGHSARQLLGVVGGILEGELAWSERRLDDAIASFEAAVEIEDGLRYDEPEPLNFSARDWLGAVLLAAERPAEAEAVYRTALEDHPHNGWSLYGLEEALAAQGRSVEARRVRAQRAQSWERADVLIRSSRF